MASRLRLPTGYVAGGLIRTIECRHFRSADRADPEPWAEIPNRACRAPRIDRPAHVLPPRHQIQVDVRPPPWLGRPIERLFGLVWRLRFHPPETIRDPVDVRVHAD